MEDIIRKGSLRLFANETTCDVVLSCQGCKLLAHRVILCIASSTLNDLLIENIAQPVVLIFPETSPKVMSLILDYIYSGCVTISEKEIDEFVLLSKILKLDLDFKYNENKTSNEPNDKTEINYSLSDLRKEAKIISKLAGKSSQGKTLNKAFPSPWTQRQQPLLEDPRKNKCSNYKVEDIKNDYTGISKELSDTKKQDNLVIGNDGNNNCVEVDLKIPGAQLSDIDAQNEKPKKKVYKCEDCDKSFSQLRNYKYHRSVHDGTENFSTSCPECGKTFKDKGYLSSHMKIHRDRKEYACQHCPKRFNQRVAYNMHVRIHTGVKPHECSTCGKSFNRKILLKQHQRVHTGEKPYECSECGKSFADRSNMSLHARLHTGVKPYACTICPKSFTKRHHLNAHMNFHNGLKPFKCQNCGMGFSQSSNMRTHYKRCLQKRAKNNLNPT